LSLGFSRDEAVEVGKGVVVLAREANASKEVDTRHSTQTKEAVGDGCRHVAVRKEFEEAVGVLG
jgi:hypothetical protein